MKDKLKRIAEINDSDYALYDWLYTHRYMLPESMKEELDAWEGRLLEVWEMTEEYRDKKVKPLEFTAKDILDSIGIICQEYKENELKVLVHGK